MYRHPVIDIGSPVNWSRPLTRGLVSWWMALPNWNRGTKWFDLCGRNHGTLTNMDPATDWVGPRGRPGGFGCLDFDGSNDYVNILGTTSSTFMLTNPFTIACWYKFTGSTSLLYVMSIGRSFRQIGFRTRSLGANIDLYRDGTIVESTGLSLGNQWHHLAGTYDGTNIALYVDGQQIGTAASGSASDASPVTWKIGSDAVGGQCFQGGIDDVFVFTNWKSPTEVLALYNDSRLGHPQMLNWIRPAYYVAQAGGGGGGLSIPIAAYHYNHHLGMMVG